MILGDRVVIADSKDPEHDLARVLLAEGIRGTVEIRDAVTGKPRTIVNIEKATKLAVEENKHRFRTVKWRLMSDSLAASRKEVR